MGEEKNGGTSLVSLIRYTVDDLKILRNTKKDSILMLETLIPMIKWHRDPMGQHLQDLATALL